MKALKYSDVCLIPAYSACKSRSDLCTLTTLGPQKFRLPIIPANMKAVINEDIAKWMSANQYFYIMHRFNIDMLKFVQRANEEDWETISVSVGVKEEDANFLLKASSLKLRIDYITIDIAHGHSLNMKEAIENVRRYYPDVYLIAGNVATPSGVGDLAAWGANCVKIGVGQGSPCTTKDKTGFTLPMFSCTMNCSSIVQGPAGWFESPDDCERIPIIADGGIKFNGDIAKALVAGATMIMAGGLFATCSDSPAEEVKMNGKTYKAYFGSASAKNKGHNNHIEGTLKNLSSNGMSYKRKLTEIRQDLQSAISYSGKLKAEDLKGVHYELC